MTTLVELLQTTCSSSFHINTKTKTKTNIDVCKFVHSLTPPSGGILEICGSAGTGKTQLCLTLCIHHILSSPTNAIAIIILENGTNSKNAVQILSTMSNSNTKLLEKVFFISVHNLEDVERLLDCAKPSSQSPPPPPQQSQSHSHHASLDSLLKTQFAKNPHTHPLIVLDCLPPLLRHLGGDSGNGSYTERAGKFFRISGCLKAIGGRSGSKVVVTNEVTGGGNGGDDSNSSFHTTTTTNDNNNNNNNNNKNNKHNYNNNNNNNDNNNNNNNNK